mgnify:CR=1 FL=1
MPSAAARIYRRFLLSYTLLLDLDDTLLENDIHTFLPAYLKAFADEVADLLPPDRFIAAMFRGTKAMEQNRQPDCTLKETFESVFYAELDVTRAAFEERATHFYAHVFPKLQSLTRPIPEAVRMVQEFTQRGYRMAIATNPMFPRTAVEQRMEWAQLPVNRYPFEILGSYEIFHFAKPDPAYYAEVLAYMGWPSSPAVIVGDDLVREVSAGLQLGMPVFWVSRNQLEPPEESLRPSAAGSLTDFLTWMDAQSPQMLEANFSKPSALLAILRSTAAALDGFCRDINPEKLKWRPQPGEWSLNEVLCHLRDVETEVNIFRIQKLLKSWNPFLPGEDTDRWADERNYYAQDGLQALRHFIKTRMELLGMLEGLEDEDWRRPARHAIFGPTRLDELVNIIAAHDRLHIQQVYRLFHL